MKISVKQLQDSQGTPNYFDAEINVEEALKQRDESILAVSPAHIKGFLVYQNESVVAQFTCDVDITLPSSRSLEPVVVPLHIDIVERYVPSHYSVDEKELTEIVMPLDGDWINRLLFLLFASLFKSFLRYNLPIVSRRHFIFTQFLLR